MAYSITESSTPFYRRKHSGCDGGADDVQVEGAQSSSRVESAAHLFQCGRAIGVMGHVIFAGPDQLHRRADRLRCLDSRRNEINVQPSAETAAQERGMDAHLLRREA